MARDDAREDLDAFANLLRRNRHERQTGVIGFGLAGIKGHARHEGNLGSNGFFKENGRWSSVDATK